MKQNAFCIQRTVNCSSPIKVALFIVFCLWGSIVQAQIKMPDMVVPNDSWGVIDVNKLYGGAMQVETHDDLLDIDVQFLKRGMLFIVVDDDDATSGAQAQMYMFLPAAGDWDYTTPFEIPAASQNLTIETASLESSLVKVDLSLNSGGSTGSSTTYYGILSTTDPADTDITGLSSATISSGIYNGSFDMTLGADGYFTVAVPVSWRNPSLTIGGDETFNIFIPIKTLDISGLTYQIWQSNVSLSSGVVVAVN